MAKLSIMTGKLTGQKMVLPEKDVTIGRDNSCEIRLSGTEISRRHCLLKVDGERITAQDLGSRNGSYVNDVLIGQETELHHGDVLRVGTMVFKVELSVVKPEVAKPEPAPATARTDTPKAAAAPKPAKAKTPDYDAMVSVPAPTDDSIVNWLIDDAPEGGTGDSTIVARTADTSTLKASPAPAAIDTPTNSVASASKAPPAKKQFASVKEEAADIIRRHLESLKA